jgi:hypothetical protein
MKRKSYSHIKLLNQIKINHRDWHNYLKMNEETYLNLLSLLTPLIKKQVTVMREAATPHGRLPATLRFLATGRSSEDLKYSTSPKVWAHRSHLYHCHSDEILQNCSIIIPPFCFVEVESSSHNVINGIRSGHHIKNKTKKTPWPLVRERTIPTERPTATCRRNLVSTFVDRGVSRGQRGGSPTVVNLNFLDRSRYFSFK